MIRFDDVTFTYLDAAAPVLRNVTLEIPEGELCLVIGPTGTGKSTLLQLVNGLAPHFTGGVLTGSVTVSGRDTRNHPPRELADLVGVVGQDPARGFVTDTVDEELAYGMEQLGLPEATMRQRVEEVVDLLALQPLRGRPLRELSGGEQQRVAIGAVLTANPRILVLDEPTSALDPGAAEEVLATILRLVHDVGLTVLLAEHRLDRVVQYADRIIELGPTRQDEPGGTVTMGEPAGILSTSPCAPPVIQLGRVAKWMPLPLSVRDARRLAGPLRSALQTVDPQAVTPHRASGDVVLRGRRLTVRYGTLTALSQIDLELRSAEVAAVMGRNGSGKSSLLWALHGSLPTAGGAVTGSTGAALVPQSPSDLLYLDTVADECAEADRGAGAPQGTAARILRSLAPLIQPGHAVPELSEGQRLALALAVQMAAAPPILLLDEPTRGLDRLAKGRLASLLAGLASGGTAILLSSHDVEFVACIASRVIVLAGGEIVADGPAAEVLTASPGFAPQVAKILHPLPFLTVDAVQSALEGVQ